MRWTPRRRVMMSFLVALVAAYSAFGLIAEARGRGLVCGSPVPLVSDLCASSAASGVARSAAVVVLLLILLLLLWVLARWCLYPIEQLVPQVDRVGPQNLGYRIRPAGRSDELSHLSLALDRMMDRIAAGYEGQRRFAANASHELRTPLAVQRTLIEVSMAGALTGQQIDLVTRQLLATNERNERLIEGLLVLSESDQGLVGRTPQRLDHIVAEVVAAHREMAAAAGVTVTSHLRERTVDGEQVLLERLAVNLLQNAIKYNRPGGHVQVSVGTVPALSVVNTGPPVPAEAVASLFEPFRRLSADRMNHDGGAGLGLTIARSITQAHDGLIRAEPAGPEGLRVDVELPPYPH